MILSGQILLNDLPDRARIEPGYLRLQGPVIEEVVLGEAPTTADAGGPHCLISPGFIDAHLHLPQFDMMGAHGLPLLEWLERSTFPNERKWQDPDYAAAMTHRVIDRLFSHGTTGALRLLERSWPRHRGRPSHCFQTWPARADRPVAHRAPRAGRPLPARRSAAG